MINPKGQTRGHELDHLGETLEFKWSKAIASKEQVSAALRVFKVLADEGNSLFLYPVGDSFIERFHEQIGFNDPYQRKKMG